MASLPIAAIVGRSDWRMLNGDTPNDREWVEEFTEGMAGKLAIDWIEAGRVAVARIGESVPDDGTTAKGQPVRRASG